MEESIINKINNLDTPLKEFLCTVENNNKYQLQVIKVKILNMDDKEIYLNLKREIVPNDELIINLSNYEEEDIKYLDQYRTQTISFNSSILKAKRIKSNLKFKVGDNEVKNFIIIEKIYFNKKLIKTINSEFPFCAPNSINKWEFYYNPPVFTEEEIIFIIANPGCCESDSFYLIDNKLIIQNKNYYNYNNKSQSSLIN